LLRGVRELVQIVAAETGLKPLDIVREVREGSTLTEIITANNGDVDQVRSQAIEKGSDLINQAVKNGRLTQERADEMLTNLETRIDNALTYDPIHHQMQREIMLRVAGETGLSVRNVVKQWRDGLTLSDILKTNGEDVQAFTDETLTRAQERLDQAVKNGRLTQEQADQRLNDLKTFIPDFLNQAFPIKTPTETIGLQVETTAQR
jgi:polyhydroxyalkanoate synthesis regulator phasin